MGPFMSVISLIDGVVIGDFDAFPVSVSRAA